MKEIDEELEQLSERCIEVGLKAGLSSVGITTAEPFKEAQGILEERKEAGYAANMQFTYRNPERSTTCLLYTSPSPRDQRGSRMPSSA